jgi:hypothetical protein
MYICTKTIARNEKYLFSYSICMLNPYPTVCVCVCVNKLSYYRRKSLHYSRPLDKNFTPDVI